MKKILLIEDNSDNAYFFSSDLKMAGYGVEVVDTLPVSPEDPSFQALVERANEFDAVIWDADVFAHGKTLLTYKGYIQAFAKKFSKPMIANSSVMEYRNQQKAAGCTHTVADKNSKALLKLVQEIFPDGSK